MKVIFPLLLMFILFSSSTCKNTPGNTNQPTMEQMNILNTTWHLESMTLTGKNTHLFPATLKINENIITGKGGCNNFFGKYELDGERITMSKIGSTRMYCQEASKFEIKYLQALEKVTRYSKKKNRLHLTLPDGELVFSLKPLETVDTKHQGSIHNPKWYLKSISMRRSGFRNEQIIKSGISLLVEKKKVSGNGGCNNYFGQLQIKGNQFIVSNIGATEMYCEETSKQEIRYFQLLEKVTTFRLVDKQLILTFPRGWLVFGRK